ncbi:MAG: tetratricopeptide repeat protein [Acidobacteriota bacterium]
MKKCPQCGRDYNDDSMSFCLDDGSELLFGPARPESGTPTSVATGFSPVDEPATAILHTTDAAREAPTRAQIHTTEKTAVLPSGIADVPQKRFDKRLIAAPILVVVIALGVYLGYRSFSTTTKQIESIAVMPFVNESGNADVEYLSDGMTETLIGSLSNVPNLSVKPRSTVFRYKGKETDARTTGKELNVQAILNGRIVQRGDQLTLSLELVDVEKDNVLWSQQYVRKQSDLVSLQSEIARDVSSKLKTKLSGAEEAIVSKKYTENSEAYQLYLKGRYYWNRRTSEGLKKAIEQFQQAIDNDPNYALAYAGLADSYGLMQIYAGSPTSEVLPKAKAAALRALEIDDSLVEAHASLAQLYTFSWQWGDADREFRRAIQLNPNYPTVHQWYSAQLISVGSVDESLAEIKRAQELDPLSTVIAVNVATVYILRGNLDAAIALCNNFIELDSSFPATHVTLALAYQRQGRFEEAITAAQKGVELSKRSDGALGVLGYCYAVGGNRSEALAILREIEEKHARRESKGSSLAYIYTGLRDKDQAFAWLEKDFQARSGNLAFQLINPILGTLNSDARYADLRRRMGLPQ